MGHFVVTVVFSVNCWVSFWGFVFCCILLQNDSRCHNVNMPYHMLDIPSAYGYFHTSNMLCQC